MSSPLAVHARAPVRSGARAQASQPPDIDVDVVEPLGTVVVGSPATVLPRSVVVVIDCTTRPQVREAYASTAARSVSAASKRYCCTSAWTWSRLVARSAGAAALSARRSVT